MVDSAREVCGSLRGGRNPKNVWWNDVVKAAWKEILGAREEVAEERYMEEYKKREVKRYIYKSKN